MDALMCRILPVAFAFLSLLAACQNGNDAPSIPATTTTTATATATSGIEGQILLGPTCPVEREGVPCEQPYKATVVIWDPGRTQRVLTFDSDDEGRFHVALSPGDYYIEPQGDERGLPRPEPQTLTVPADTFVSVTLRYDTGIR
jgi:hypothetical protein